MATLDQEYEYEDELEGEPFLGGLLKGLGGALGLGEGEYEGEYEDELEGEPFLPALLPIAKMALPLIGSLFGGRKRREMEGDGEYEYEGELTLEAVPISSPSAMAEVLAAVASKTPSEAEAEAMAGAATVMALSAKERAILRDLIPRLVQVSCILTRLLRRKRVTRPVVRVLPTLVKSTAVPLVRRVQAGKPITGPVVARVMQTQTRKLLTKPAATKAAVKRNTKATKQVVKRDIRTRRPISVG